MCLFRQKAVRCLKKVSPAFVRNNQEGLLALAMTANKFGGRPSGILGILDDVVALDLDNAAAMRLQQWEDERLKMIHGIKDD